MLWSPKEIPFLSNQAAAQVGSELNSQSPGPGAIRNSKKLAAPAATGTEEPQQAQVWWALQAALAGTETSRSGVIPGDTEDRGFELYNLAGTSAKVSWHRSQG